MKIFKNKTQREDGEQKLFSLRWIKITLAAVLVLILAYFMFTCEVREGTGAVILRFGAPRAEITEAGLHLKLPWPFETVERFENRLQYLESNYLETTTKDNRNIILQSYAVWRVTNPLLYYNSVGAQGTVDSYIKDQIFSATNSVMGAYNLTDLVSLEKETIKTEEIQDKIYNEVKTNCEKNYGIEITDVNILRISLPNANLESVFAQMRADRQKDIDTIIANAQRDANKIKADADAEASKIIADGQTEAAAIKAKTETEVAQIYASAQAANVELYKFLQELDTVVASVNKDTVLVVTADSYPFNVLLKYGKTVSNGTSNELIIEDLNYIMTQLPEEDASALTGALYTLISEQKGVA